VEAAPGLAMDALKRAVALGYDDVGSFRFDSDLESLRDRPDFRVLHLQVLDRIFPKDPFARPGPRAGESAPSGRQ